MTATGSPGSHRQHRQIVMMTGCLKSGKRGPDFRKPKLAIAVFQNKLFVSPFVRPFPILVNLLKFTKGAPRRRGRTKFFIKMEINFLYDFGK